MQVGQLTAVLTLDKSGFDKGLNDAKNESESSGSFIGNAFGKAKSSLVPLVAVAGTLTAAIGAAGYAGLGFNNAMEKARARLNAFNKDANTTEQDLSFINDEASKTPFAFEEMVNAFASLKPVAKSAGVDVKDLLSTSEILAALNPAQGLEGAAIALRSAVSGDFTSAIERFDIPRELIQKLKDEGVPNAQIVGQALQSMGYDATLVSNMAATAEGRWSTFTDTLKVLAGTITQPIFDAFSSGLGGVNDILSANQPLIQAMATALAGNIKAAIEWFFTTGVPTFVAVWNTVAPLFSSTGSATSALGGVISSLMETWRSLQPIVNTVVTFIQTIVTTVFTAIQNFINAHGEQIKTFFSTTWVTIQEIIRIALDIINATIVPLLTGIANFIAEHGTEIENIINGTWTMITSVINIALAIIKGVLQTALALIRGDWSGAWTAIKTMFITIWENIKTYLTGALEVVSNILKIAWEGITTVMRKAWDGLLTLLKIVLGEIKSVISDTIGNSVSFIEGMAGRWRDAGSALISNFFSGLKSKAEELLAWARQLAQDIADILPGSEPKDVTSPLRGLGHRGEALIGNFQAGVERASSGLYGAVARASAGIANTTVNNAAPRFEITYMTQQSSGSVASDVSMLQALTRGS